VSRKLVKHETKTEVPYTVATSLQDRAKAAFFSNYVFEGSKSYDFLRPFYSSSESDTPLSASLEATSLAFFAHQANASPAAIQGRKHYVSALSLVHQAISCPLTATKDSTLLATMVLDLYEKITNLAPDFDQSWKSHVTGSLALVGLRGTPSFHDRNGSRMIVRLSTNLLISCVATDTYLPAELAVLRKYNSNFFDNKDPKWLLTDVMLKYMELRRAIGNGNLNDQDTIDSLLDLEEDFLSVAVNSPNAWQCQRVRVLHPLERVLDDHMDVFSDHHITQTHNVGRLVRIFLNESLLEYSSTPAGLGWAYKKEGVTLRSKVEHAIVELVSEICASVPQYTCPELLRNQSLSPSSHAHTWSEAGDPVSITRARVYTAAEKVRNYTLIFPLFVAAQSISVRDRQKRWIVSQLYFMASSVGIKNAEVVTKILEAGVKINPWKVYALLGSYAFAT
jgi:hypothetical protein